METSGTLVTCERCGGLAPARRSSCPHCDRPLARLARRVATVAGGGAFLMTLMACYGGPPRCPDGTDQDGDRYCTVKVKRGGGIDCDDKDPNVRPLASDPEGDGKDQNCDGVDGMAPSGSGSGSGGTGAASGGPAGPPLDATP